MGRHFVAKLHVSDRDALLPRASWEWMLFILWEKPHVMIPLKQLLTPLLCSYEGRVVYTPTSFIDILPDHYKQKPISLYNPRKAPMLNQYRLIVPRTRNILEICHFLVLLVLFVFVMADRDPSTISLTEVAFIVYTCGCVLDQFSSILEHGQSFQTFTSSNPN
jgi:hypothetical protein